MPDHSNGLSIATTTSGLIGGLLKAFTDHMSASSISLAGAVEVAVYATISASVGYGVKRTLDSWVKKSSSKR